MGGQRRLWTGIVAAAGMVAVLLVAAVPAAPGRAGGAAAGAQIAALVGPMRGWRDDPLAAADQRAPLCDRLGALVPLDGAVEGPPGRPDAALTHFVEGCRAYDRALTSFPVDRARWETYWNDSLNEGVVLAMEPWMRDLAASQARLSRLRAQWRDLAAPAEQDRARGCAALAAAGVAPDELARAC